MREELLLLDAGTIGTMCIEVATRDVNWMCVARKIYVHKTIIDRFIIQKVHVGATLLAESPGHRSANDYEVEILLKPMTIKPGMRFTIEVANMSGASRFMASLLVEVPTPNGITEENVLVEPQRSAVAPAAAAHEAPGEDRKPRPDAALLKAKAENPGDCPRCKARDEVARWEKSTNVQVTCEDQYEL